MPFNNFEEVTNSDHISLTDRTASGPQPDGTPPTGNVSWGSITDTPTSAAGYGIVNGSELDAFAAMSGTGIVTKTAANTYAARTLTAGDNVSITNGSGVAGNPTIAVPSMPWADVTGTPTTLAGYGITDAQPLDADLTAIAALTPTDNDIIQRKSGAWTNRSVTQYWNDILSTVSTPYTSLPFSTASNRLLGRTTALPGSAEEITPGSSLSFAAGILDTIQDIRTTATPTFAGVNGASSFLFNLATAEVGRWNATSDLVIGGGGDWGGNSALLGRGLFVQRQGAGAQVTTEMLAVGSGVPLARFSGSVASGSIGAIGATAVGVGADYALRTFGTSWVRTASVMLSTTETHSGSALGTYIGLNTVLTGATTLAERARINGTGDLVVGGSGDWLGNAGLLGRGLFVQRDTADASVEIFTARTVPACQFGGTVTGGTLASPSQTPAAAVVNFRLRGRDNSGNNVVGANYLMQSTEAWTSSARGTSISIQTILTGASTLADRLTITGAGDTELFGSIKTAAPSGGAAQPWKLGNYTAGVAVQAGKVRVEINGVAYDLLTA